MKYPGLFAVYAVPLPGHTPEEMRAAIHKELDRLKSEDISDEERWRASRRVPRPTCCAGWRTTMASHINLLSTRRGSATGGDSSTS